MISLKRYFSNYFISSNYNLSLLLSNYQVSLMFLCKCNTDITCANLYKLKNRYLCQRFCKMLFKKALSCSYKKCRLDLSSKYIFSKEYTVHNNIYNFILKNNFCLHFLKHKNNQSFMCNSLVFYKNDLILYHSISFLSRKYSFQGILLICYFFCLSGLLIKTL